MGCKPFALLSDGRSTRKNRTIFMPNNSATSRKRGWINSTYRQVVLSMIISIPPGTDSHWVSGLQLSWTEGFANQSPLNGFGYRWKLYNSHKSDATTSLHPAMFMRGCQTNRSNSWREVSVLVRSLRTSSNQGGEN
jgi:hypothetical protein